MCHWPVRVVATLIVYLSATSFVPAQPRPQPPQQPPLQPLPPPVAPENQGTQSSDPRHILLPGGLDRGDAKQMLERKLRRNQDLQQTKDLATDVLKDPKRYGLTEEDLAKWINDYQKNGGDPDKIDPKQFDTSKIDPNDPKIKSLIDKIKDKEGSLTEDQKESLKRMDEYWKNRPQQGGTTPPTPPRPPIGEPPVPPNQGPAATTTPITTLPPQPKPKPAESWWAKKTKDLLPKGDNATMKKGDAPSSEWSRKMRDFSNNNLPKFNTRKLNSNTPTIREGPRVNPNMPNVKMPGGGGGGGSSAGGLGRFLLGLLACVVLGVLAFLVFRLLQNRRPADANDFAALGLTPVDPAHIRTRADLVRAFEYLALKLLGMPARNEHHLEIGAQLGATPAETPQRRAAAGQLAHLYEQARYTPPEEELSPAELQAARRDLALLGGATAS